MQATTTQPVTQPTIKPAAKASKIEIVVIGGRTCAKFNGFCVGIE